jgi:hypothetical protein
MSRNYSSIYKKYEAEMLADADKAITECDLWGWLKTYVPDEGNGFMFAQHPNLDRINEAMKYEGHSGSSYAWTMRVMEQIAKGSLTIPEKVLSPLDVAEAYRTALPDGEQQYDAMKKFSDGKMSYAEMRGLCG